MRDRNDADESFAYQAVEYLDIPPMDKALTLPPVEHEPAPRTHRGSYGVAWAGDRATMPAIEVVEDTNADVRQ